MKSYLALVEPRPYVHDQTVELLECVWSLLVIISGLLSLRGIRVGRGIECGTEGSELI